MKRKVWSVIVETTCYTSTCQRNNEEKRHILSMVHQPIIITSFSTNSVKCFFFLGLSTIFPLILILISFHFLFFLVAELLLTFQIYLSYNSLLCKLTRFYITFPRLHLVGKFCFSFSPKKQLYIMNIFALWILWFHWNSSFLVNVKLGQNKDFYSRKSFIFKLLWDIVSHLEMLNRQTVFPFFTYVEDKWNNFSLTCLSDEISLLSHP